MASNYCVLPVACDPSISTSICLVNIREENQFLDRTSAEDGSDEAPKSLYQRKLWATIYRSRNLSPLPQHHNFLASLLSLLVLTLCFALSGGVLGENYEEYDHIHGRCMVHMKDTLTVRTIHTLPLRKLTIPPHQLIVNQHSLPCNATVFSPSANNNLETPSYFSS